jgi:hypothetical protein
MKKGKPVHVSYNGSSAPNVMRKYDSGLGEHGTRTKGAENGASREVGGGRDNKTKPALKIDPRLQTRRRNGAAHPRMWGIKVGVLEWKMRPFGLKRLQRNNIPERPHRRCLCQLHP